MLANRSLGHIKVCEHLAVSDETCFEQIRPHMYTGSTAIVLRNSPQEKATFNSRSKCFVSLEMRYSGFNETAGQECLHSHFDETVARTRTRQRHDTGVPAWW